MKATFKDGFLSLTMVVASLLLSQVQLPVESKTKNGTQRLVRKLMVMDKMRLFVRNANVRVFLRNVNVREVMVTRQDDKYVN